MSEPSIKQSSENKPEGTKPLSARSIQGINYIGLNTLIKREVGRFLSVYLQTIIAPVITTLLFYLVFALAFGGVAREIDGMSFMAFLAPGLIMMTMVQNAFSNTSSSLVIAKIQGNIVDTLMPPLSNIEILLGFLTGGVLRGFFVGGAALAVMSFFAPISIHAIWMVFVYAFLGNMLLSSLGIATGIWAEKFDHVATITNFVITPLTFLSGTFYSVKSLPETWHAIALYNPFFYMIDGFRAGFIGYADGNVVVGIPLLIMINIAMCTLIWFMLRCGYKIKT